MSVEDHTQAWRNNVRSKGKEIQKLLSEVLSLLPQAHNDRQKTRFEERLNTLTAKCSAMHHLYGPNLVPGDLNELTDQLREWKTNLHNADITRRIAELWTPIGQLDGNERPDEISFTAILEKHKQDETLQKCLDELISALETLLADGDDTLSSQAAKELGRILEELKKRKNQSLFDIQPWIEFALVSTGAVADLFIGAPLATVAAAAVIAAKESQIQVQNLVTIAHREYIESLQLKGHEAWDRIFGRTLKGATPEEIKNALEGPAGIKGLLDTFEIPSLPPPEDIPLDPQ